MAEVAVHFKGVLNVDNDVDPAALRGIPDMLAATGPSRPPAHCREEQRW